MASTYSNLKIQLMATGENSGTWGNVTNVNLGTALEEAIVGSADVTFASGTVTLTLTDSNSTQAARNLRLNLTGTSGGAQDLIVPTIEKVYIVNNGCADAITVKNTGGTGIAVPAGKTMWVYNDGTNVVDAVTHLTSLTVAGTMTAANVAGDGSALTALNATAVSSGTLSNDRTTASSSNGASTIIARDANGSATVNVMATTTLTATTVNTTTMNATGSVIDAAGNVRAIPPNAQTTTYTFVIGDAGKYISTNSNVTVPNAVFSDGDVVSVFNSTGSNISVLAAGSVTLRQAGTANTGTRVLQQYGIATVLCTSANNFIITGSGLA